MELINKTTDTIIAQDVIIADSFIKKHLGLLTYDKPRAMILRTRFGIHTFGMRYPIDIIILDKNNRVVKLKKSLKPNRIFLWNPLYPTIIELPPLTLHKTHTSIHNYIYLK